MVLGALGALAVWLLPSWFPVAAAVQADRQDTLYFWLMVMSSFIFSLVIVFLVYMMVKFRAKPGDDSDGAPIHGHTGLEIVWTVIPIVIVLGFAIYGAAALGRNEALAQGPADRRRAGPAVRLDVHVPELRRAQDRDPGPPGRPPGRVPDHAPSSTT